MICKRGVVRNKDKHYSGYSKYFNKNFLLVGS